MSSVSPSGLRGVEKGTKVLTEKLSGRPNRGALARHMSGGIFYIRGTKGYQNGCNGPLSDRGGSEQVGGEREGALSETHSPG